MPPSYASHPGGTKEASPMRVLLIGGGGREHALAWALAASPLLTKLWVAPGNPGIAPLAECVAIDTADIAGLAAFARANAVDLVVPGPEAPLVAGLADALAAAGVACCGPPPPPHGSRAARPSPRRWPRPPASRPPGGSASPTPPPRETSPAAAARPSWSRRTGWPAGKGVVVAQTEAEADAAIDRCRRHGPGRGGGVPVRRGGQPVRAVRRHGRGLPRHRAGPQAGGRRRQRAEHRRHGRGLAGARLRPRARDGRHHPPRAGRDGPARHPVPRRAVRRADADRRTARR